jgi:hypothetical protein
MMKKRWREKRISMKTLYYLSLMIVLSINSFATEIQGPLTGILPLSGSPYQVVGDIYIPANDTLSIEPGVVFDFQNPRHEFKVSHATLVAIGTESDSIIFTSNAPDDTWFGIQFDTCSTTSILEYCGIENSVTTGIRCLRSSPIISHCTIQKCSNNYDQYTRLGTAIFCMYSSSPTITDNLICDNWGNDGTIALNMGAYPLISGNIIARNRTYGGGVAIGIGFESAPIIRGNQILNNFADYGDILDFLPSDSAVVDSNIFIGNKCLHSHGAIQFYLTTKTIFTRNIMMYDTLQNVQSDPGLFSFLIPVDDTKFSGNIISNNYSPEAALFQAPSYSKIPLFNNVICDNQYLGIKDSSNRATIIGVNNIFWSNNPPDIASGVYLFYCDVMGGSNGRGNIDFDPLFRNPDSGDYHLMSTLCGDNYTSPCIDAGSPAFSLDSLACDWGLGADLCDMGAYGGAIPRPCNYMSGDINDDNITNVLDVVYMVNYLKGGAVPMYFCPCAGDNYFYVAGDVNGNCAFNGIDITFFVRYLKLQVPSLLYCSDCPPASMAPPAPGFEPIKAPVPKVSPGNKSIRTD